MALQLLAFRLKNDSKYPVRYGALVNAIKSLTQTSWEEGTAFYFFIHSDSPFDIHARLHEAGQLYYDDDMLLVYDVETGMCAHSGVESSKKLEFILGLRGRLNALGQSPVANALLSRGSGGFST